MAATRSAHSIGFVEFVVLAAATMSTQAIAIDAMLPAFPTIVRVLNVADPNHGQWIVTAYMTGMGIGQLFWGMLSDRFGRRPILLGGLALYVAAALLCSFSGTFHTLLAWRFVHGLAAACVTVTRSVIRDLYSGRQMARVMSLTFVVFLTVPILAPSLGQLILLFAPWRYIFAAFAVFAAAVAAWGYLRLPETLHPEYRLTLTRKHVLDAAKLVLGNRASICYTLAMMVMFGTIMAYVGMVAQIFSDVFHRPNWMPSMFALCAIFMGMAGVPELAHRRTLGHASDFPQRVAPVHRGDGPARTDRGARCGTHLDLRVAAGDFDGVLQLVGVQFRRHGDGAGRLGRRNCCFAAGIHLHFQRGPGGNHHRRAIQRHHDTAGGGTNAVRIRMPGIRAVGGEGAAVQGASFAGCLTGRVLYGIYKAASRSFQ